MRSEKYEAALEHLRQAGVQRDYYDHECEDSRWEWLRATTNAEAPVSLHLSFDYAQNLQYPFSPQQVGPAYFRSGRKCGIFGVHNGGSGIQMNYLIDECETNVGKGTNSVVSQLHNYLENYSQQAHNLYLQCDNCCGQNKNKYEFIPIQVNCISDK